MAQLKFSLKTNTIKAMFFDIFSNVSKYYYAYGRALPWDTITETNSGIVVSSEDNPPAISDTYSYELGVRRDILYTKAISSSDASIVVRRLNWQAGSIYDMYDDYSADNVAISGATSIDQANFYVLTSDFNVYKCLFNNNDARSLAQPNSTNVEPVTYTDGYIWKFMYTLPLYLRNKFLTSNWMPCTTALTNQFYSNGSITSFAIENKGFKYPKNSWKVKRIIVIDGGAGYSTADFEMTFPDPTTTNVDGITSSSGITAIAQATIDSTYGNIISIAINNENYGYPVQPIPIISGVGIGFKYNVEYERSSGDYTELRVSGDGYNEENPYSLKTVTVIDGGSFDIIPQGTLFTFVSPDLPYGFRPEVEVVFERISGTTGPWKVAAVNVTNTGYGYTFPLRFTKNVFSDVLTTRGFSCDLNEITQRNQAELIPLINESGEIEAIQVNKQGSGYTYANIDAVAYKKIDNIYVPYSIESNQPGYVENWAKATIQLNFGIGDIETKQSNVELLAVDGAIPVILVTNGGNTYNKNSVAVTITGDGYGAAAVATVDSNGSISLITVTNPGQGYTYADILITGGAGATARAILSPKGGHGKDAVSELYANTIMLVNRIASESALGIDLTNNYRQITILKNPRAYGTDNFYKKATGTSCVLVTAETTTSNSASYNAYAQYDELVLSINDTTTKKYTIIDKYSANNKYYLLLQLNDNYVPIAGSTLTKDSKSISISSVVQPDFNKYSGEMLYIDNRVKFASTAEQTIATTTLISF